MDGLTHGSCNGRNDEVALCGVSLIGEEEMSAPLTCPACVELVKHGTCPQCGAKSRLLDRMMRHRAVIA